MRRLTPSSKRRTSSISTSALRLPYQPSFGPNGAGPRNSSQNLPFCFSIAGSLRWPTTGIYPRWRSVPNRAMLKPSELVPLHTSWHYPPKTTELLTVRRRANSHRKRIA
uniref:(northern house mosquito) hypothetical protein n=1 Tax=Culex pipiens TaxID=7175 RepID=A0A8D8BG46_CULPI